jgi:hypothetical protein
MKSLRGLGRLRSKLGELGGELGEAGAAGIATVILEQTRHARRMAAAASLPLRATPRNWVTAAVNICHQASWQLPGRAFTGGRRLAFHQVMITGPITS